MYLSLIKTGFLVLQGLGGCFDPLNAEALTTCSAIKMFPLRSQISWVERDKEGGRWGVRERETRYAQGRRDNLFIGNVIISQQPLLRVCPILDPLCLSFRFLQTQRQNLLIRYQCEFFFNFVEFHLKYRLQGKKPIKIVIAIETPGLNGVRGHLSTSTSS